MYTPVNSINTRITRSSNDSSQLYLPTGKLKVYTDSYQYSSALAWNKLPSDVRSAESVTQFRGAYHKWFKQSNSS